MPFLSIIVPTYNRAHLIKKTLISLLDQSFQDYEIIVVDDGSTDNTEEVVCSLQSPKIVYYKIVNGERAKARNFGMQKATGKYINWFDSDDLALPHHCETIHDAAQTAQLPDIIRVNYELYNPITKKRKRIKHKKDIRTDILKGNSFGTASVIVKRDIALSNPFEECRNLSASEDYELWLRLVSKYRFTCVDTVTNLLVEHKGRSVRTMSGQHDLEKRFLTLIHFALSNPETTFMIGSSKKYFLMRNYLVLSVDLAYNRHKKKAVTYVWKASKQHPLVFFQRVFWATLKHLIF
ncbi:glycosyltransferase family 2 protein [Fluviicola chungangensis]|uniref:Glycosyltransferase family 2 protein n=1 Tax=Fluviicola chungangensis TaxID=2597671 RepID=A0A556MIY3_9FLAO|nr:glycosyltransferase family A protein [Fluviicola chungangensis]TSJ39870.1 glycosyltransferase family 2 protein [Fluviicola chungangensis]